MLQNCYWFVFHKCPPGKSFRESPKKPHNASSLRLGLWRSFSLISSCQAACFTMICNWLFSRLHEYKEEERDSLKCLEPLFSYEILLNKRCLNDFKPRLTSRGQTMLIMTIFLQVFLLLLRRRGYLEIIARPFIVMSTLFITSKTWKQPYNIILSWWGLINKSNMPWTSISQAIGKPHRRMC